MGERKRTSGQPAQYQRSYREKRKAAGLCTTCGETPAEPGKTKCTTHRSAGQAWWKANPEYGRENQRRIRQRRSARTEAEILADQQRLRPDGLKLCKRRASHDGPIVVSQFYRAPGEADGLQSVCKACNTETYRRRAEKHWRAVGIPLECIYCGGPYEHVDHVISRRLGGTDKVQNLMPSCAPCNQEKGSRPLEVWRPSA